MPIKKSNITYAEIYVRDLLIERDSASFYRNLITQLSEVPPPQMLRALTTWAKLEEGSDACADGWLPGCDDLSATAHDSAAKRHTTLKAALRVALAAESKVKLYYEGAVKRTVDPSAQALAETRMGERQRRIQFLQEAIAGQSAASSTEALRPPLIPAQAAAAYMAYGGIRFVHSEPA